MDRRAFIETVMGGTAAAPLFAQRSAGSSHGKMIGIQVGASSLAAPDFQRTLDILQERAHVNTLFVFIFTYVPDWTGLNPSKFHGGNFATVHPQYYRNTALKPEDMRASDFGDLDLLARLLPESRKRGMKTFCWVIEDNILPRIPNVESLWERDLEGRIAGEYPGGPCSNNPNYRNFLLGLFEDYARSYEIDGVMWGAERQGAFGNALGAYHEGADTDPGGVTCFCEFCKSKAKSRGIDVERAQQGFRELQKFVKAGRAGKRPTDGYYVTLWRILLRCPEILAWEMFWIDSVRETQSAIYRLVKSIKPVLQVGWHIWHNNSFNPIYRAEQDYRELSQYSDFIKPVLYNNCAGERLATYIDSVTQNICGDFSKQEALAFEYRVMNYQEAGYDKIPLRGLSSDYVYRETKRALEGVAGTTTQVWPGIDLDVPTAAGHSKCTRESVREAVIAGFRAGAHGVLLSRLYTEMKPESLAGAGDAIRELGLA